MSAVDHLQLGHYGLQRQPYQLQRCGCRANPLRFERDSLRSKGQSSSNVVVMFPKAIEPATEQGTTDGEQMGSSLATPEHTRVFKTLADHGLAPGFHDA